MYDTDKKMSDVEQREALAPEDNNLLPEDYDACAKSLGESIERLKVTMDTGLQSLQERHQALLKIGGHAAVGKL